MKLTFHGAAGTVTGSKHLITLKNNKQILLDCGMFQGMPADAPFSNDDLGFDPSQIDYVFLSHAHIDHSGLLPVLLKQGFSGRIFGSSATLDMTEILLRDSAFIQAADVRFMKKKRERYDKIEEPLYTMEDVEATLACFESLQTEIPTVIDDKVEVTLFNNGHILGATTIFLTLKEEGRSVRLSYSGDVGRYGDPILKSPSNLPQADYIIVESTYGNRLHEKVESTSEDLRDIIVETCVGKRGKLIIPAFSVGRTQELLYTLNELELDYRLPDVDYYVDSPLSTKATLVVKKHPECFNRAVQKIMKYDKDPFQFKGLKYIEDKRASQALNSTTEPCVIISASGMAEAGRVKHHIANSISDARNSILLVGYCEKNTLGARLKLHPEKITIYGEEYPVNADIFSIDSMSAHADYNDLCQYLSTQDPDEVSKVFIVHGEPEAQEAFKDRLLKKGFNDVVIPVMHEMVTL